MPSKYPKIGMIYKRRQGKICRICGKPETDEIVEIEYNVFRGDDEIYPVHYNCRKGMSRPEIIKAVKNAN